MQIVTSIFSSCGCLIPIGYDIFGYVDQDENPYVNQNGNYYVPFGNMADQPVTFAEMADAPALTAMAYFVGTRDNGDNTFTDYKFTPAQLAAYFAPFDVAAIEGNSITLPAAYSGRTIIQINPGTQQMNRGFFTQVGDTATMTDETTFYAGQIVTITLGA